MAGLEPACLLFIPTILGKLNNGRRQILKNSEVSENLKSFPVFFG
jgi:hypothetical protein